MKIIVLFHNYLKGSTFIISINIHICVFFYEIVSIQKEENVKFYYQIFLFIFNCDWKKWFLTYDSYNYYHYLYLMQQQCKILMNKTCYLLLMTFKYLQTCNFPSLCSMISYSVTVRWGIVSLFSDCWIHVCTVLIVSW